MKLPNFITNALINYFKYFVVAVVVLVLTAGYFLVIGPKITSIQSTDITVQKNAESDLAAQKKYLAALQASNAKFEQVLPERLRTSVDTLIPSEADFPGLILTVKNIVGQAQLTLDAITVGESGQVATGTTAGATGASTGSVPSAKAATIGGISLSAQDINITVSGGTSYQNFKQLLGLIESSQRLFNVTNVSFSKPVTGATEGESSNLNWTLTLRTYYLPSK